MGRIKSFLVTAFVALLLFAGIKYLPVLRVYISSPGAFVSVPDGYIGYHCVSKGVWSIVPEDMAFDETFAPYYVYGENSYMDITISLETAFADEFGGDMAAYVEHYYDRFMLDGAWCEANSVMLISDTREGNTRILHLSVEGVPQGEPDSYIYLTVFGENSLFWRIMIRYDSASELGRESAELFCKSLKTTNRAGGDRCDFSPTLTLNSNWSEETLKVYGKMRSGELYFGLFTEQIETLGMSETIPKLQKQFGYDFPILLDYVHIDRAFPSEFMNQAWEQGKVVELTLQLTDTNNEQLFAKSAQLALYRGEYDDEIRAFARAAAEFSHPFLFRLNNEMNSDWTSWSGVVNLCDPQIYVWCWRHVYDIFEQEGVDNAIWIFNPNDIDYPPACWNTYLAYFPGDEYVHMIGLTGYNTGTYYADVFGESWRSFSEIYDALEDNYGRYFSDYPWIITEFASSSVGGDKAAWIDAMFADIHTRKNICACVWFDMVDYDFRNPDVVARPYRMADSVDCVEAFYRGLGTGGFEESLIGGYYG